MASRKLTEKGLTPKEEKFCALYISKEFYANGVESYAEAFGINIADPKQYNVARTLASKLLSKVYITSRITEHLDLAGFNDENIDKQLLLTINQCTDFNAKVRAIEAYNKLRQRIEQKQLQIDTKDCRVTLKLD